MSNDTDQRDTSTLGQQRRSQQQKALLQQLAQGVSLTKAAVHIGVAPSTVYRWREQHPSFDQEVTRLTRLNGQQAVTAQIAVHAAYNEQRKVARRAPRALQRDVMERDAYRCRYCGGYKDLQLDHAQPFNEGGPTTYDNLITCCAACNSKKGSRTPDAAGMPLRPAPM